MLEHRIRVLVDLDDIEGLPVGSHAPSIGQGPGLTLHRCDNLCHGLPEGFLLPRQYFAGVGEYELVGWIALLHRLALCRHWKRYGSGGEKRQKLISHDWTSRPVLISQLPCGTFG